MSNGFDPAGRLRKHVQGLVGRPLGSADLIEVMRLLRLVLEQERLRDSDPHAALYCDWLLHGEIDRHEIAIDILGKMHVAMVDWDRTHDTAAVARAMNLPQLRGEMAVIFAGHQVPTDLLDSFSNWKAFLRVLLEDLSQRPLKLPKKPKGKTKKKLDNAIADMVAASKKMGGRHWARAFFITCEGEQENRSYSWNLEWAMPDLVGNDHLIVKGELLMPEEASAFRRP
jgi:hypothetical protein